MRVEIGMAGNFLRTVAFKTAGAMLIAAIVLAVPQAAKGAALTAASTTSQELPASSSFAVGSSLSPGRVVERALAGGENHSYRLSLAAGQDANIVVEQRGIDTVVRILG